jgi:hypothetical protein
MNNTNTSTLLVENLLLKIISSLIAFRQARTKADQNNPQAPGLFCLANSHKTQRFVQVKPDVMPIAFLVRRLF